MPEKQWLFMNASVGHFITGEEMGHFVAGTICRMVRKGDILSSGTVCRPKNSGGTLCRWDKMSPNRESEAFILGNGREREFPLTPESMQPVSQTSFTCRFHRTKDRSLSTLVSYI